MKKKVWILLWAAAVLMTAWRLWPRSLYSVIDSEQSSISMLNATVLESGPVDGEPSHTAYQMQQIQREDEHFTVFLSILEDCGYRPDFRNLLPWAVSSVESGSHYSNTSAKVSLYPDRAEDGGHISLSLLDSTTIAVSLPDQDRFLVFHPTDREMLSRLARFVKDHGTEQ